MADSDGFFTFAAAYVSIMQKYADHEMYKREDFSKTCLLYDAQYVELYPILLHALQRLVAADQSSGDRQEELAEASQLYVLIDQNPTLKVYAINEALGGFVSKFSKDHTYEYTNEMGETESVSFNNPDLGDVLSRALRSYPLQLVLKKPAQATAQMREPLHFGPAVLSQLPKVKSAFK